MLNSCSWYFSTTSPVRKAFTKHEFWVRSNKNNMQAGCPWEPPNRWPFSVKKKIWRSFSPSLPPPVAARLVFTDSEGYRLQGYSRAGGGMGMGMEHVKSLKAHCFYRDSDVFLNKDFPDFVTVLFSLLEERIYRGPYSAIINDISVCLPVTYFLYLSSLIWQ